MSGTAQAVEVYFPPRRPRRIITRMGEAVQAAVTGAAVKVAKWAWEHQDEVESQLAKLYRSTRRKLFGRSPSVLILGPGGVGKTTLGRILSGRFDFLSDSVGDYEQSVRTQTFRDKGLPDVELVVAPGQADRREATWPQLLGGLSAGKVRGVILCGAYGYHSLTISHKLHKLYKADGTAGFLSRFLPDRRAEELKILTAVTGALAQSPRPAWLLSYVGKEDLWSAEEAKVREFYTAGEYAARVREVSASHGTGRFRHEVVFGSLVIRNFTTPRGGTLATNVAGYDHVQNVGSLRLLFETVAALEAWKGN